MPRAAEISVNEKSFISQALQEGLRLDGRDVHDYRAIDLRFGEEYGHAQVNLGKTRFVSYKSSHSLILTYRRVAANISAQVVAPFPDRKFEGIFSISTEISPMASPAFEIGRYVTI